ncbi:MAG: MFS transporter [Pseudomonadota bacterium]
MRINRDEIGFVARLSVVSVSRMFGLFMVLPVMALWVSEFADATPALMGIAVGAYGVTQAFLQMPYGALSDRIGRAPVVVFGLSIFAAGSVIAATTDSIFGVICGRLLQGAGAVSATLSAWLADRTRTEVRTPAMAIFGATIGASFLLALVLGPLLSAAVGVRGLFWLSAGLGILGVLLVIPDLRTGAAVSGDRTVFDDATAPGWQVVLRRELILLDLGVLILHAALLGFFVLAPFVLIERLGWRQDALWQVYTGTLMLSLLIAVPMIMADGKARATTLMRPAVGLLVVGMAAMSWSGPVFWIFGLGACLFFAGFSYLEAALPAELSRRADAARRGASLGVFASAQFLGAFVGSTTAGWIVGVSGPDQGFIAMFALLLIWLVVDVVFSRRSSA